MDKGVESYQKFLSGDNDGFVELVRQYKDGLVLFISTFTSDLHIAEEAADEVFLKLYVKRPEYRYKASFKTWLYAIGRNTALTYLRKAGRNRTEPLDDYLYICDETDIEENYIKDEQNRMIRQAIRELKTEYAQVLWLTFFEGAEVAEIASIMGKSSRQVSDLLYRAKKALRTELERRESNGQV